MPMNQEQIEEAFQQADAVLKLEGMEKPPGFDELQRAVIEGRMTFDEAVAALVKQAREKPISGSKPIDLEL